MNYKTAIVTLTLALTAPFGTAAHAAPPQPQPPSDLPEPREYFDVVFAEGYTGVHDESYDEDGSEVEVLDRKWVTLHFNRGGELHVVYWFNTRRGSDFFMNFCDQNGEEYSARVTRKAFMERVATTWEEGAHFSYDAQRDRGTFRVATLYDEYSKQVCPVRPR